MLLIHETKCPDNLLATKCPILRQTPDCDNTPQPTPICVGKLPVLRICNSNGVEDDHFAIYIDGNYICDFNILGSSLQELRIFPASGTGNTVVDSVGSVCNIFVDVFTSVLDSLASGTHLLEMRYVSANCCGSFGQVQMVCANIVTGTTTIQSLGIAYTYSGSHDQSFKFYT